MRKKTAPATDFSARHYDEIARIISNLELAEKEAVARAFGASLLDTNPRFSLTRFLRACGLSLTSAR